MLRIFQIFRFRATLRAYKFLRFFINKKDFTKIDDMIDLDESPKISIEKCTKNEKIKYVGLEPQFFSTSYGNSNFTDDEK